MLHIVAGIKYKSSKITHLKVFDGYSFKIYDIATFVMLFSTPNYAEYEHYSSTITSAIQAQEAHIRLNKTGIILEGYSDLPILNEKGKVLRPGRVIFTQAGADPVKAIQSGFKEVQCKPKDISQKLVCNLAEYNDMLSASEYTLKWEDCESRFEILFPEDLSTRCFMSGIDYNKNRIGIYACSQGELSILSKGILVDSTLELRLENSAVEKIVLPIAVKSANLELINCPKLKSIICPYGTRSITITGSAGTKVYQTTLQTATDVQGANNQTTILHTFNSVGVELSPRGVIDPTIL